MRFPALLGVEICFMRLEDLLRYVQIDLLPTSLQSMSVLGFQMSLLALKWGTGR